MMSEEYEMMTTDGSEMRWPTWRSAVMVADAINGFVLQRMDGTFAVGFYPERRRVVEE
jgi:hypothetical protein